MVEGHSLCYGIKLREETGKNTTIRRYSCPRDWRLLASLGPIMGPLETLETPQHYRKCRV